MAAVLPLVVSLATPAAAAKSTEVKANVTPQEIIVKFKDNVSESKVKSLAVKGKDEVKEKGSKFHVIKVKDGNVDAAIAEYEASG
ncbi:hypothetical protein K4H03_25660, partial [Mycobacterium tuberculosis]|nr:hypothetical protein [Mycobacterium tuberculosis]